MMRWLIFLLPLLIAAACTDTEAPGDQLTVSEAQPQSTTPVPARQSPSATASPTPATTAVLGTGELMLLVVPDEVELSDLWASTFIVSAAELEEGGARIDYPGQDELLTIVISLHDTHLDALDTLAGFTTTFTAQGFEAETLAVGDRAERMSRQESPRVFLDSLNVVSGLRSRD